MGRLVTLTTCQWADLDFETLCKTAKQMGYDGLEIACWGNNLDPKRAAEDPEYVAFIKDTLNKYGLVCKAIATHIIGQCVGDYNDPRLNNFAPAELADQPDAIRAWGIEIMKYASKAAKNLGVHIITGFTGSPIWKYLYSFPQTTEEQIEAGLRPSLIIGVPVIRARLHLTIIRHSVC